MAAGLAAFVLAGRELVVADPLPSSADAIVILGGSIADRVLEAADLYRAGVAPRVIVTRERLGPGDGVLRARGIRLTEGDRETMDALHRLGVPPAATFSLRRRNDSTASEVRTIARWACSHGTRRLVAVTSRPHTRRVRLLLRTALGPGVSVRPSRYDTFDAVHWWRDRRDAKAVLSEYQKLANFWLRERWTLRPCGGLARRR